MRIIIETSWYKKIKHFIPSKIRYIFLKKAIEEIVKKYRYHDINTFMKTSTR